MWKIVETGFILFLYANAGSTIMSALPKQKWTLEEYFELETTSETKHEYFQGNIYAMSGGSLKHALIATNTSTALNVQLRKSACRVFQSDLRLQVTTLGYYTYPDILVVCGEPKFYEGRTDTVTNPVLIVEVLSPSTESYDRGKKFQYYRTLDGLQEYVVISQDAAHIERFTRQPDGDWLLHSADGLGDSLELLSVNCTLALSDVYDKVDFEDEPE
jgi:Uma2 family endonuclease